MRILFIPLDTLDLRSNHGFPSRIYRLSLRDKILGVERVRSMTKPSEGFSSYIKFLFYAVKVFLFGLRHRNDFDLIYCYGSHAITGAGISIMTGKPCVEEKGGVFRIWCQKVGKSRLFTLATLISEKAVARFTKMTIVLSEVDKQAYIAQEGFDPDKIVVIPPLVDLSLADEVAAAKEVLRKRLGLELEKRILIFTGTRESPENREAAWWINQELAPAIAQRFDDAQILMTGSGEIPQPTHPIITFTGFVPNVFEYILAADISLAPMEHPEGLLTKVLDSMSCGKPTVVMASAANGIPQLVDGYNAMVAKDRGGFIEKTLYLLEHLSEAQEIGVRARKTIEEHYSWQVGEKKLSEVLDKCLG